MLIRLHVMVPPHPNATYTNAFLLISGIRSWHFVFPSTNHCILSGRELEINYQHCTKAGTIGRQNRKRIEPDREETAGPATNTNNKQILR